MMKRFCKISVGTLVLVLSHSQNSDAVRSQLLLIFKHFFVGVSHVLTLNVFLAECYEKMDSIVWQSKLSSRIYIFFIFVVFQLKIATLTVLLKPFNLGRLLGLSYEIFLGQSFHLGINFKSFDKFGFWDCAIRTNFLKSRQNLSIVWEKYFPTVIVPSVESIYKITFANMAASKMLHVLQSHARIYIHSNDVR